MASNLIKVPIHRKTIDCGVEVPHIVFENSGGLLKYVGTTFITSYAATGALICTKKLQ